MAHGVANIANEWPINVLLTPKSDRKPAETALELFADRVIRSGNRCAVTDGRETLTYGELNSRAEAIAAELRSLGAQPNEPIAVCLKRSATMIGSFLGVWKAGAGYLALDPTYPAERLGFMLKDAGARILLAEPDTAPDGDWRGIRIVDPTKLATIAPALAKSKERASAVELAYVIYTSGSTGRPKGVGITHRNLLNLIAWHCDTFAVVETDKASQLSSPAFDAAVWEIWPYLTSGASLHLPDDETRNSPTLLRDWLVGHEITIGFVPTVLAESMIGLPWPRRTKFRTMLTGGDVLHRRPPQGLPFRLINNYGPTECTVVTTSAEVAPGDQDGSLPPIGRPISNVTVHVLDEMMVSVPPGAIGEIFVGGAGVAAGYLNRPDLTAERFVPDPFRAGGYLYKTGDLGTILPDGQVSFHGRSDEQIKIRGYRIEPQEIVAVLNSHPDVRASAVVAQENGTEEKMLVAYVVPSATPPARRSLVQLLREKLPDYMLPSFIVLLESLPVTSNGKLDRGALPAANAENMLRDDDVSGPRTIIESHLTAILQELLQVERVGREDNFFLLGGHSLLGTQVIAKVRDIFGIDLPLRSLFESPTVTELAATIEALIRQNLKPQPPQEAAAA